MDYSDLRRLQPGDLIEITLRPDAREFCLLSSYYLYVRDESGKTDLPGRSHSGSVISVNEDYLSIGSGWHYLKKEAIDSLHRDFYFDAIESFSIPNARERIVLD